MDIPVARIIYHQKYGREGLFSNDIALIRLAQSAPYTDYIRPICLPVAQYLRDQIFDGIPLLVAGFGRTGKHVNGKFSFESIDWMQFRLNIFIYRITKRCQTDA